MDQKCGVAVTGQRNWVALAGRGECLALLVHNQVFRLHQDRTEARLEDQSEDDFSDGFAKQ
jgi:hypothetical protein